MPRRCESFKNLCKKYGEPGEVEATFDELGNMYFNYHGQDFILTEDGDVIEGDTSSFVSLLGE